MRVVVVGEAHLLPGVRSVGDDPHRYWPAQELATAFRRRGWAASVLCLPPILGGEEPQDPLVAAFGGTLDLSDDLASLIRKRPVDLVVAESWRTGLAAFRAVRLQEVPLVVARTAGAAHPWDMHGLDEPPPGPALEPRLASLALRCLSRTPADLKAWLEAGVGQDQIWQAPPPLGRDFGSSVASRQPVLVARDADRFAPFIQGSPARPFRLSVLSPTLRPRMGWSGGVRMVPAGATRRRVELLRRAAGVVVDRSPLDIRLAREALACGCPTWVLASDGVNLQQARVYNGELDVFGLPVSPTRAVTGAAAPLDRTEDGSSDLLAQRLAELAISCAAGS